MQHKPHRMRKSVLFSAPWPILSPFPAPCCVNVTTKRFVRRWTQVYSSHRGVLCLVRAHKTLRIMSPDTLCILNQFARSVISIIAGVWHGGQTLSALCSALWKLLAPRKITLESKYWLKRLCVLWTICSPWTMSLGWNMTAALLRSFPKFNFFLLFPQRLRRFANFPAVWPLNFLWCFSGFLSFLPFL